MKLHKYIMLLSLPLALAACGGGDGGGDRPVTKGPVANAGTDQTVSMGTKVLLDGRASETGTNGSALSYSWTMPTKPAGSGAMFNDAAASAPSFQADLPGQYVINLVVNDGVSSSQPDSVTVRATTTVPVAIVDVLQKTVLGELVTLDGSQSAVPEGGDAGALVYRWSLTQRPADSVAEILGEGASKVSFLADKEGEYQAKLVVKFGDQESEPRIVAVQAIASNRAPVAVPAVVSVNGQPAEPTKPGGLIYRVERGQEIKLDGSGSTDADGDALSYRWNILLDGYSDNFAGSSLVNGSQLSGVALPYGKTASFIPDVVGTWKATLAVFDGTEYASKALTFTVTKPADAPNTPPVVAGITHTHNTNELEIGEAVTLTATPAYDIDGDGLYGKFRWRFVDYPASFSPPDVPEKSFSGLYFTPSVGGAYTVEVIANDGQADSTPVQATFTALKGANKAPRGSLSLDKNTVMKGDDLVYTCGGSDPNGDEMHCSFVLLAQPEGSQATLRVEGMTARVKTDKPGTYTVSARVRDAMGAERDARYFPVVANGFAKSVNNPPVINTAVLAFNSSLRGGYSYELATFTGGAANFSFGSEEQPFLLGGKVQVGVRAVDPDNDYLYYLTTLQQQPSGSELVDAVAVGSYEAVPTVPGKYVVQFIAHDGVEQAAAREVSFHVVKRQDYPSILIETAGTKTDNWSPDWYRQTYFPYLEHLHGGSYAMIGGDVYGITYRLTAFDRDYTIADLKVSSTDPAYMPYFSGLQDKQVIRKGDSVEFMIFRPYVAGESAGQSVSTETIAAYDFSWSFRIAEKEGWTFDVRN